MNSTTDVEDIIVLLAMQLATRRGRAASASLDSDIQVLLRSTTGTGVLDGTAYHPVHQYM